MNDRPFETLIKHLSMLETIHGLYDQAALELESTICAPICMQNCGKCCETVMVWGIEVEGIASYLIGQGPLLNIVMDRCEEWLGHNSGYVPSVKQLKNNIPMLLERAQNLMTQRCPLIGPDQKCPIYDARPLACRAFGVTTYPQRCPRPTGIGESGIVRAYNQGLAPLVKRALNTLLEDCAGDEFSIRVGFLPTLLMSRLRSEKFTGMVDSGKVDPVKLVKNYIHSPTILAQDQRVDFSLAGDEALQEVEKKGINTGPLILSIK